MIGFLFVLGCKQLSGLSETVEDCPSFEMNDPLTELIEQKASDCYHIQIENYVKISSKPFLPTDSPSFAVKKLFNYHETQNAALSTYFKDSFFKFPPKIISPSALWLPELSKYLVVARFTNFFNNLVYASLFDENWEEVTEPTKFQSLTLPSVLPIPSKKRSFYLDPSNAKVFRANNGEVFVIVSLIEKLNIKREWLFSLTTLKLHKLEVDQNLNNIEKNWSPLVIENKIFMVYNHQNLQVLDCSDFESKCVLVTKKFDTKIGEIRGGTPYVRFSNTNYYVSFNYVRKVVVHKRLDCSDCWIYRPIVTIIKVDDLSDPKSFEMIYNSELFDFENKLLDFSITGKVYENNFKTCYNSQIFIVGSIAKWNLNLDEVDLVVNINDRISAAVRIKGLTKVVKEIINNDFINHRAYDYKCPEKSIRNYIQSRQLYGE